MKLPRETLDGFLTLVFPLLLRRRDVGVALFTRVRQTTIYDVRVQVRSQLFPLLPFLSGLVSNTAVKLCCCGKSRVHFNPHASDFAFGVGHSGPTSFL